MNQSKGTDELVDMTKAFVHMPNQDMKLAIVSPNDTLRKVLHSIGVETVDGLVLLVGEPTTSLEEGIDEIVDDEHAPADLDKKLSDYWRGGKHVHLHCHTCSTIAVTVRYGQHDKTRKFSPARTIARVRAWAIHKFRLHGDAAADKLVIELCDSDKRPRPEQHLGELTSDKDDCAICLELVQSIAPQG